MTLLEWSLLGLVTLIAAAAQGATGFGFALLVVSFYLVILNSVAAVQLTIAVSLVISVVLVPGLWRAAPRALLLRLVAGSVAGFPIGLAIYHYISLAGIKMVVALLIICFAGYLLSGRRLSFQAGGGHAGADLAVGVVSGAMATCLAMPGPSVLLYLQAMGAAKEISRATTLTLFAFSYASALILQASVVGIDSEIWIAVAVLAPLAMIGAGLGHFVSKWLSERIFRTSVLIILVIAGAYTLWTSVVA